MADTPSWPTVSGTGHRPQHLSMLQREWTCRKAHVGAVWLRDQRATRVGVSGLALGFDTWWAQAVLEAGLALHVYIPFEAQPALWRNAADVREWHRLRGLATEVHVIGPDPQSDREAAKLLNDRNVAMLGVSDAVIAGWVDGRRGGTRRAVRDANRLGLPGVLLDPARSQVRVVPAGGWLD